MINMFQNKMAGGSNDPDDLIVRAFKAYEAEGKIEAEMFRHALMNFGDKFSQAEVDDIFGEFDGRRRHLRRVRGRRRRLRRVQGCDRTLRRRRRRGEEGGGQGGGGARGRRRQEEEEEEEGRQVNGPPTTKTNNNLDHTHTKFVKTS